jgi:putative ribosome biogenesis GTPase RsgA
MIDRYPGARPFADTPDDQRLFFGRSQEIDILFHQICATRLLVLFGKSGLGKTSLLQRMFPSDLILTR